MHHFKLHTAYNPNHLLNAVMEHLGINTDGELSHRLKIARDVIKDIRGGHVPVAASLLLSMQEATGISIDELRSLMGDRRAKFRLSYALHPRRTSACPL